MIFSCTRILLWTLGVASVAISSPVDVLVAKDVIKSEEPLQMNPNCQYTRQIWSDDSSQFLF